MEVPLLQKRTPCLPLFFFQQETEEYVPTWTEPFSPFMSEKVTNTR
jgi:hypothetical protein